jgi:hypothetical protein
VPWQSQPGLCDRNRKIVMSGNAKDIATNEDVRKSYLGY